MHIYLQNTNLKVVSNMHNTSCSSSSSNCWRMGRGEDLSGKLEVDQNYTRFIGGLTNRLKPRPTNFVDH